MILFSSEIFVVLLLWLRHLLVTLLTAIVFKLACTLQRIAWRLYANAIYARDERFAMIMVAETHLGPDVLDLFSWRVKLLKRSQWNGVISIIHNSQYRRQYFVPVSWQLFVTHKFYSLQGRMEKFLKWLVFEIYSFLSLTFDFFFGFGVVIRSKSSGAHFL